MTSIGNSRPIGVFDSGVGGLTVLKKLAMAFPSQSWVYLGDTARLPYGTKSGPTIKIYTEENLTFLSQFNCQAYIIACNSASAQFSFDEFNGVPVFKVIKPGTQSALKITKNNKIGIIGTKATIQSRVYENELSNLGFTGETFSKACPLFVPLVEEGLFDDPITELTIDRYLKSMKQVQIDTLILGCTHYPLLKESLQRYFGDSINLVSSETQLVDTLTSAPCLDIKTSNSIGDVSIYTTDQVETVSKLALSILADIKQAIHFKNLTR